jgi:hypothetical protein
MEDPQSVPSQIAMMIPPRTSLREPRVRQPLAGRRRLGLAGRVALGAGLVACTTERYTIVTIEARPAVHDATTLTVRVGNAGTTRIEDLALGARAFPVSFSVSAPGRTGEIKIAVDAVDQDGRLVGRGLAVTTAEAGDARLMLEPADFVVNSDYANDQFPADDFEASGFQLAASPDGTWTAAFRDACPSVGCSIYGRRFNAIGQPLLTEAAASANAFTFTTKFTAILSTPAIAAGPRTTLAVWDAFDIAGAPAGVACRALDQAGAASPAQLQIGGYPADDVTVTALANGNFVASWNVTYPTENAIRSSFLNPDCTVITQLSASVPTTPASLPTRSTVAAAGDRVLYAWLLDASLHIRLASTAGAFVTPDRVLVPKSATQQTLFVRAAAATGGGFVLAASWVPLSDSAPGRIVLLRLNSAGELLGEPTVITDKIRSDFDNSQAFSMATRPDGTLLVAWHTCGTLGDGSMCGVFGRILRDTGEPVTDEFGIPTTTTGDQVRPSVIGLPDAFVAMWTDTSAAPPDTSGTSVRARILYPPTPVSPPVSGR